MLLLFLFFHFSPSSSWSFFPRPAAFSFFLDYFSFGKVLSPFFFNSRLFLQRRRGGLQMALSSSTRNGLHPRGGGGCYVCRSILVLSSPPKAKCEIETETDRRHHGEGQGQKAKAARTDSLGQQQLTTTTPTTLACLCTTGDLIDSCFIVRWLVVFTGRLLRKQKRLLQFRPRGTKRSSWQKMYKSFGSFRAKLMI